MARLAMVVCVALLVSAGCGGSSKTADPAAIVAESVAATGRVKTFHFTLDIRNQPKSSSGIQLSGAEGDVVVPDRLAADVSGTLAGTPLITQLVVVGPKTWIKDPLAGTWRAVDVKTSPIPFFSPATGVLAVMRGATGLTVEGTEKIGDADTYRLAGTVTANDIAPLLGTPPGNTRVDAIFWVGKDDSILRRVRVDGPVAPGEPDDISRTIDVSRFGEHVTIQAPEGA